MSRVVKIEKAAVKAKAKANTNVLNHDNKQLLAATFVRCFEESLRAMFDQHAWKTETVADAGRFPHEEFFMVTISSHEFRVLVLLHFTQNDTLRAKVAEKLKVAREQLSPKQFYDYLGEIGNLFCGALKRELGRSVTYLGMSVPNHLTAESLDYLKELHTDYDSHVTATAADGTQMLGSMYMQLFSQLDLQVLQIREAATAIETGALEMF